MINDVKDSAKAGMEKAVEAFQTAHGLEAEGVAGKGTYEILFSDNALKKGETPTPMPTETPQPEEKKSGIR